MGSASSKQVATHSVAHLHTEKRRRDTDVSTAFSEMTISHPLMAPDGTLSTCAVNQWEASISANPKLVLGRTVLHRNNLRQALQTRSAHIADQHVFNTELEFKTGPVTNQKSSGRCWLFATTNVLRYNVMKKLKVKEFQLSQVCLSISGLLLSLFVSKVRVVSCGAC